MKQYTDVLVEDYLPEKYDSQAAATEQEQKAAAKEFKARLPKTSWYRGSLFTDKETGGFDLELFHKAFDAELQQLGLLEVFRDDGKLVNSGTYGKFANLDKKNPAVKAIKQLWATQFKDEMYFYEDFVKKQKYVSNLKKERELKEKYDELANEFAALVANKVMQLDSFKQIRDLSKRPGDVTADYVGWANIEDYAEDHSDIALDNLDNALVAQVYPTFGILANKSDKDLKDLYGIVTRVAIKDIVTSANPETTVMDKIKDDLDRVDTAFTELLPKMKVLNAVLDMDAAIRENADVAGKYYPYNSGLKGSGFEANAKHVYVANATKVFEIVTLPVIYWGHNTQRKQDCFILYDPVGKRYTVNSFDWKFFKLAAYRTSSESSGRSWTHRASSTYFANKYKSALEAAGVDLSEYDNSGRGAQSDKAWIENIDDNKYFNKCHRTDYESDSGD